MIINLNNGRGLIILSLNVYSTSILQNIFVSSQLLNLRKSAATNLNHHPCEILSDNSCRKWRTRFNLSLQGPITLEIE